MLRLKANKTSLYNLVATYKPLPGMDLAARARSTMDEEKCAELYSQMQQYMVDEAPCAWLYQQSSLYAYNSKRIQGWQPRVDEVVLMDGVTVS